jgi:hypothetical protein
MFTTALQLIIEASKRLITQNKDFIIDRYTLGGLILTVVLKGILYLYCRKVDGSASAEALAQGTAFAPAPCSMYSELTGSYMQTTEMMSFRTL